MPVLKHSCYFVVGTSTCWYFQVAPVGLRRPGVQLLHRSLHGSAELESGRRQDERGLQARAAEMFQNYLSSLLPLAPQNNPSAFIPARSLTFSSDKFSEKQFA